MDQYTVYSEYLAFVQSCVLFACAAYCLRLNHRAPSPFNRWPLLAFFFALVATASLLQVLACALNLKELDALAPHFQAMAYCALLGYGSTRLIGGKNIGLAIALFGALLYMTTLLLGLPADILRVVLAPLSGLFALSALLTQLLDYEDCATRGPCPWRLLSALYVMLLCAQPVIEATLGPLNLGPTSMQMLNPGVDSQGVNLGELLLFQGLPTLLAAFIAIYLGVRLERATSAMVRSSIGWHFSTPTGTLLLIAILLLGFTIPYMGHKLMGSTLSRQLLMRVQAAGKALAPEWVVTLSGRPEDVQAPIYKKLITQLSAIRRANPDLRFVYLVGKRANTPIILLDTEPPQSPDYAPPGEMYNEAPQLLRKTLHGQHTVLTPPYTDRWGTWISGFTPITDISGRTFAVLGMDLDAKHFNTSTGLMRISGMGVVLLACGLIPAFFAINRRNLRLHAATRLLRDESDARQRAQAGQERSEEQYRTLVEKAYDGMALVRDGTVLYANPKFASMTSLTAGEMIGRPVFDFVPSYRGPLGPTPETGHKDGGKYEAHITNARGRDILAEIRSTPVVYRNRAADLVTLRDVTRMRENELLLREAEARFALVFTNHPLAMVLYQTATGAIVDANPAAVTLYGYTRDEMLGLTFADIASSCGMETTPGMDRTRRSASSIEWHVGKNKVPFPVEASTGVFNLSRSEVACMAVRSAMRRVEHVRAEREARKGAQNTARRYRDVLHFAGRSMQELVESAAQEGLSGPHTTSMHLLADTLRALDQGTRQDAKKAQVDPLVPLRTAMERFAHIAKKRNIQMVISPLPAKEIGTDPAGRHGSKMPETISASPVLLHLVLANMIHSALATSDQGIINMNVEADTVMHTLLYSVGVTGPGLPSSRLSQLFALHPSKTDMENAPAPKEALGISLLLAENMAARIRVHSDPQTEGTTYILEVPFGFPGAPPAGGFQKNAASAGKTTPEAKELDDADETLGETFRKMPGETVDAVEENATLSNAEGTQTQRVDQMLAEWAAKEGADSDPSLGLWNKQAILQRLEIDELFLMDLCDMFHSNTPEIMERISRFLEQGNLEETAKQAHALKNECMNVGSDMCRDISEQLVRVARLGQRKQAQRLGSDLAEAMKRLLDVLPKKG